MSGRIIHILARCTVGSVLLITMVAACAPAATPTEKEPVKIVFWSHDFPPREKLDREYMDKFMQGNPHVEVEYVLGPADDVQYITKLMTAMAGGEGPDCFNLLTMAAGPLVSQGALAPIDPQVFGFDSQEALEKSYVEGTLEGFKYDGMLYAVPSEVSVYSLFVNSAMFADAGLNADEDYPRTWEDLIPLAQQLNQVEGDLLMRRAFDFTYGMPDDVTSPVLTLAGMAYQLGGTVLNAEGTEATVNTEPWIRASQFIQDWVYKEKLGDPTLTVAFIGFYEGSVGMTVSGSWYSSYIKEQGSPVYETYTVKPLPRWGDAVNDTSALMYAYGLFTNAAASPEKQQACQGLIRELSAHPEEYLESAGLLQPTVALAQSDVIKEMPSLGVFLSDMEGTPYWPTHPKSFEISDALTRALQRMVMDNQPVEETLNQAKQEIDELLQSE